MKRQKLARVNRSFFFFVFLIFFNGCSQAQGLEEKILGKWQISSISHDMGEKDIVKKFPEKGNNADYEFKKDGELVDLRGDKTYNYFIVDSVITMNSKRYFIESLNDEEMVLSEVPEEEGLTRDTYTYKRVY